MGLSAGPVPPRVHGDVKAGLLTLIDRAEQTGFFFFFFSWSTLGRVGRCTPIRPPNGRVLALAEQRGQTDRSHRKLAHRGSRLNLVHVSESTVLRVLTSEGLVLPRHGPREPQDTH